MGAALSQQEVVVLRQRTRVKQADIERMIRAARAAGLTVKRVITTPEGVSLETSGEAPIAERPDAVL